TLGRDRRRQRLGVSALVERLDLVLALALVELLRLIVERVAELPGHRVPEMDLGLGERGRRRAEQRQEKRQRDHDNEATIRQDFHDVLPTLGSTTTSRAFAARRTRRTISRVSDVTRWGLCAVAVKG